MDLETAQITTTAKLPTLKQGEYDMWRLRIEQYFQVQDYALWDVIENGNSFKPAAKTTTNADGTSTTLIPGPVTTEENVQKKNDMKARSASKLTESLDSIVNSFRRCIVSWLILGENISQEDLNLKFLRSLPSEWNYHVVRNCKLTAQALNSQNMAFVSSPSSTNEVNTTYGVGIVNKQVSLASTQMDLKRRLALQSMRTRMFFHKTSRKITINGSDIAGYDKSKVECFNCHKMGHFARNKGRTLRTKIARKGIRCSRRNYDEVPTNMALMAFLDSKEEMDLETAQITTTAKFPTLKQGEYDMWRLRIEQYFHNQPNGSRLVYVDVEQIHEDDIEEIDLKWQLALLSMRTRREYRGPRNQDNRNRNQDSSKRTINVEEISSKSILAIDGTDSEFNKSEFNLANYKRGFASVEEQLVFYKKNEVIFCEQLAILKRDISYKDSEISVLKSELEKLKQEKESNQLKIENFNNASKSLDKLIGSQILDKSRKGLGFVSYNVVPPPPTGLFSPPNLDLSYSGLEEFQQPEFEGYGPKTSKNVSEDTSNEVRESPDALLVEELVSDDKLEKKTVFPTVAKIEFVRAKQQEKPVRKPVKYAEMYRSQSPRGNQRNWNNQKSQQLGSDFVMYNKACFVCGSFDHVQG
ncbi:ribonuclease H-like domain-containing protein [Tanacetum coccineum]